MSYLISPTARAIRGGDKWGSGSFLAPRGDHKHWGADFLAEDGQVVVMPCAGSVLRKAYPYADDLTYCGLTIRAAWGGLVTMFYIAPLPALAFGGELPAGADIARSQSLQRRYPGISDHVHSEVRWPMGLQIPLSWVRGRDYEMRPTGMYPGFYVDPAVLL